MKHFFTLLSHEVRMLLVSPSTYIAAVLFLAIMGFIFTGILEQYSHAPQETSPAHVFFAFFWVPVLFMVPLLTMKCLAEERRLGTIEMLLTLPLTQAQAVIGKFLAAWVFCIAALVLTFPFVITVNYLGSPDNGAILAGYIGAALLAGSFLAIGSAMSALTRNQVIAFVLGVAVCFLFAVTSYPVVTAFISSAVPELAVLARRISVVARFQGFVRGTIDLRDLVFFASFIGFWLYLNTLFVKARQTD